tara:strand:- start:166 stop:567 length:402 start_codon:yes stop_codon:yes gene_type:complete
MADSPSFASVHPRLLELGLVGIGAVPGALIRWQAAGLYFAGANNVSVNVIGALVLGLIVGRKLEARWQLLIGTGFCGSLTTFSSWMVDCVTLMGEGKWAQALGLIGITLGLGLGFGAFGLMLGRRLRPPEPTR